MKSGCVDPERLDEVLALEPTSPERVHLESCPRCKARLLGYRELMDDRSVPPEANLDDARRRLRAAFDRELDHPGDAAAPSIAAPSARLGPSGLPHRGSRGAAARRGTARRTLLARAVAVVALVSLGIVLVPRLLGPGESSDELRGPSSSSSSSSSSFSSTSPAPAPLFATRGTDGSLEFRWRATSEADGYEVLILGSDLAELARFGPVADTSLTVPLGDQPPALREGRSFGWQVRAMRAGSPVAASAISIVRP